MRHYNTEEEWEADVCGVWEYAGASEVATQRLLILGAKWQKGEQARQPWACMWRGDKPPTTHTMSSTRRAHTPDP